METPKEFRTFRARMNGKILSADKLFFKRFYNLDTRVYEEGELPALTKEMLGLATSMVLRCDDCIKYHLEKCFQLGLSKGELMEVFSVANLVGGSIVIPHTRRALEYWDMLETEKSEQK